MVDYLGDKLKNIFSVVHREKHLTENNIKEIIQEIKIAFLDSDVNYSITQKFIENLKKELLDTKIDKKLSIKEHILNTFYNETLAILGNEEYKLNFVHKPTLILMVGLQGSGKTTTVAKLAYYFKNKLNKKVLVVACDIHRHAAYEQLKKMNNISNIETFFIENASPSEIAQKAIKKSHLDKYDIVIFDTAGRIVSDEKLMNEIVELKTIIKPKEIIFTVDAMSGQGILTVTNEFHKHLKITCAILSKFDSEARSGAAFTLVHSAKIPILFVGTGEKITDLEKFYPDRVTKRIMGQGDIQTLVEKASEVIDEKKGKNIVKKFMSGKFSLDDLVQQFENINKMGSLKSLVKLIPGAPKLSSDQYAKINKKLKIIKSISNSATKLESNKTNLLYQPSRKTRIIKGSGVKPNDYNLFLKELKKMKDQSKKMKNLMKTNKYMNMFN